MDTWTNNISSKKRLSYIIFLANTACFATFCAMCFSPLPDFSFLGQITSISHTTEASLRFLVGLAGLLVWARLSAKTTFQKFGGLFQNWSLLFPTNIQASATPSDLMSQSQEIPNPVNEALSTQEEETPLTQEDQVKIAQLISEISQKIDYTQLQKEIIKSENKFSEEHIQFSEEHILSFTLDIMNFIKSTAYQQALLTYSSVPLNSPNSNDLMSQNRELQSPVDETTIVVDSAVSSGPDFLASEMHKSLDPSTTQNFIVFLFLTTNEDDVNNLTCFPKGSREIIKNFRKQIEQTRTKDILIFENIFLKIKDVLKKEEVILSIFISEEGLKKMTELADQIIICKESRFHRRKEDLIVEWKDQILLNAQAHAFTMRLLSQPLGEISYNQANEPIRQA